MAPFDVYVLHGCHGCSHVADNSGQFCAGVMSGHLRLNSDPGVAGSIAHVVVMPNITSEKLEVFCSELIQSRGRVAVAAARSLAASARALHQND
jgi:hypothetical protein